MPIRPLVTALGLNAIPALGWFVGEWSAGTMLVLYWLETLIGTLLFGCRIVLHRRLVPSKGHWDYQAPQGQGPHTPASPSSGRAPTIRKQPAPLGTKSSSRRK